MALVDLCKVQILSTGSGLSLTLGAAVVGFDGIGALANGFTYSYSIQQNGNWEYGRCTYALASSTITRSPIKSSYGLATPLPLSGGAQIAFTALAEDISSVNLPSGGVSNTSLAAAPANTLKGNASTGNASPTDLSVANVRALLAIDQTNNTSDVAKPVSTAQAAAITAATATTAVTAFMTTWMASLPTAPPSTSKAWWNNSGQPTLTP